MLDKPVFRMSSAGRCPRALTAEKFKYPSKEAPSWLETAAREGRRHEKWVKEDLVEEGYEVEDCDVCPICLEKLGEERNGLHVELDCGNFLLLGHTDGRVKKNGKQSGLEVKSMSQYEFDRWMKEGFEGFQGYAAQITVYMKADPHGDWLYVAKNRSSGYTLRTVLTECPADFEAIKANLELVIKATSLVERDYNHESIECRRCEFKQLCIPAPRELSPVEEFNLQAATRNWRKGKELEAQGAALVDSALQAFGVHSEATGMSKWRYDELLISQVNVRGSVAYPKKKLLEVFTEEMLKQASEIKLPYSYIKVKELREDKEEEYGNAEMSE